MILITNEAIKKKNTPKIVIILEDPTEIKPFEIFQTLKLNTQMEIKKKIPVMKFTVETR
jgi:hypothetical protein